MASPRPEKVDHRVLNLAKELADTRERRMPAVLLKLKDILDGAPAGTPQGAELRREVWEFNILHMLVIIVRQDFSIMPGQWNTAAKLSALISQASCGMELTGADRRSLLDEQLPRAVEHLFLLAKHIQQQMMNMPRAQETAKDRTDLTFNFKEVLESLMHLASVYYFLCEEVMKSPWLLQLLISDEAKTVNMAMAAIEKTLRCDGRALSKVKEEDVLNLMDELIYKLSVNNDISIAAGATRCVLRFCESHKPLVEVLFSRYKGLRPLLRRWEGRGFERDLRQLFTLLQSGSALTAQSQRKNEAASHIQAVWKGVLTRKRLLKANKAFSKFQRTYRCNVADQINAVFYLMVHLKEIMPADQIERYLMKEKSGAAVRIQTIWRGHRERNQLALRQQIAQQVRAAIKIQRAVRLWLDRIERQQQKIPTHMKPSGLTEERRVQIQEIINRRRQERPTSLQTQEEVSEIHTRAHHLLMGHYSHIRRSRKKQYQWENLLARLDTDSELLVLAPPLREVTEKDVEMYSSRSLPVATKAKQQHNAALQKLQRPWWRQQWQDDALDQDEQEKMEAEMQLLML